MNQVKRFPTNGVKSYSVTAEKNYYSDTRERKKLLHELAMGRSFDSLTVREQNLVKSQLQYSQYFQTPLNSSQANGSKTVVMTMGNGNEVAWDLVN